jgi:hypothetical protein
MNDFGVYFDYIIQGMIKNIIYRLSMYWDSPKFYNSWCLESYGNISKFKYYENEDSFSQFKAIGKDAKEKRFTGIKRDSDSIRRLWYVR